MIKKIIFIIATILMLSACAESLSEYNGKIKEVQCKVNINGYHHYYVITEDGYKFGVNSSHCYKLNSGNRVNLLYDKQLNIVDINYDLYNQEDE